jgi:hypothetical protein
MFLVFKVQTTAWQRDDSGRSTTPGWESLLTQTDFGSFLPQCCLAKAIP